MIVYRVENVAGQGPYRGYENSSELLDMSYRHCGPRWPTPFRDALLSTLYPLQNGIEYKFGFGSMPRFHAWFSDNDRDILHRHGFLLAVYDVSAEYVLEGLKQVMFKASEAKRLSTTSLFAINTVVDIRQDA